MAEVTTFPGTVEWSGENPGISLKTDPAGPFTTLASFFRVILSPHGRGHALVLAQAPGVAGPQNLVLTDNEPLARWLVAEYVSSFAAWRGLPALTALEYRKADRVVSSGDPRSSYSETVRAGDLTVALTWSGLGEPFCFANPPDKSATGKHWMPSLFIGCDSASITVNGKVLPGQPMAREVAGRPISTAMLAFAETWVRP
jgi:hypothetical protein